MEGEKDEKVFFSVFERILRCLKSMPTLKKKHSTQPSLYLHLTRQGLQYKREHTTVHRENHLRIEQIKKVYRLKRNLLMW